MDFSSFNPNNNKFCLKKAYLLAKISQLSYSNDSSDYKSLLIDQWKFTDYCTFSIKDTQALVTTNDDVVIIAFRGTEWSKIRDIITDVSAELIAGPLGFVHAGFKHALDCVWDTMLPVINKYNKNNNKTIWITGHSLGAALAVIAAAYLSLSKKFVSGIYTFGQPRTGDNVFKTNYNLICGERTFRFVNNKDIITDLPLEAMRYRHVNSLKFFDENGLLYDTEQKNTIIDKLELPELLTDHKIQNYIDNILFNEKKKA